ncbi:LAO/AO transport system kinase [Dongia mobilis]|uniref:LAO/AO transport system kinase n=1 Tax=Dongia mobilis TaxID=578943 RepID=A0A4V3DF32_9PROT|nr:methylmalonyl Co-A mutase-associated GTPase MeaB [Dongia mobilis]TDQ84491.1 LAO/AO transport system kinase [Dongia mobilis]
MIHATPLAALRAGGKTALARALAQLESSPDEAAITALLDEAHALPTAHVIGLTGPPGVGKSTLAGALIQAYRAAGKRIAVIAIDPSSKRSGGALLGDRTRLRTDPEDDGIFVRSMAARDQLGGLAEITYAAMVLMRALYDVVLIETVGVGQSETDIALAADTVLFCVQPGSGDSLQFMKAGIVEIPDVVAVTKGDLGRAAIRARADVKGALGLGAGRQEEGAWQVPVLIVSANAAEGIDRLVAAMDEHAAWLREAGRLARKRAAQASAWIEAAIRERWGREGLKRLAGSLADVTADTRQSPFRILAELARRL